MFCSKCGKQAEGTYCWNCGAELYKPTQQDTTAQDTAVSEKKENRKLADFVLFNPTISYPISSGTFEIDDIHQMMRVMPSFGTNGIYWHWQDIVDAELVRNDSSVYKTSTSSMITRAALGSLISTGMGIVAGATAKRNEQKYIDTLYIRVTLKNCKVSSVIINFISGKSAAGSWVAETMLSSIESALRQIQLAQTAEPTEAAYARKPLIDDAPKPTATSHVVPTPSGLKWRCPQCDNLNSGLTCKICGINKPSGATYLDTEGNTVQVNESLISISTKGDWRCPECDFQNRGSSKTCTNCGQPREEDGPTAKKGLFGFLKR
ncbi:MAG: zinc finger Ran-binding domain-containing protein [Oscillospiraceae bacterium]